jgi:hypothetical protein
MLKRTIRAPARSNGPSRQLSTTSPSLRTLRPPRPPTNNSTISSGPAQRYPRSSTAWLHGLSSFDGERAVERQRVAGQSWRTKNRGNHRAAMADSPGQQEDMMEQYHLYSGSSQIPDDALLREIFDSPFTTVRSSTSTPTGLFRHPNLRDSSYFQVLTERTLIHAYHLVDRILQVLPSFQPSFHQSPFTPLHPSSPGYAKALRETPKLLDRLSDTLCLVMDMAELVRNVHPEQSWVEGADMVYEVLGRFMNGLNTNTGLYDVSWSLTTESTEMNRIANLFFLSFDKALKL